MGKAFQKKKKKKEKGKKMEEILGMAGTGK